ncbi:hypothetical protein QMY03_09730 [Arthrobacter sp. KFRI-F3372]|nr:hypothetical protein QMY03_09730 [Arthrobacter sp. KFRI-F3372]
MSVSGSESQDARTLREQIRKAVDPSGQQFAVIEAVESSPDLPLWLANLKEGLAEQWSQLGGLSAEYLQLLQAMDDSLRVLVPRGWAPFHMDSKAVDQAVHMVRAGRGDDADELLADQWEGEGSWRTKQVFSRVSVIGAGEEQHEYHALFRERARLIAKAKEHHEARRYEASIPLIQNQMEGIVMDVAASKKLFTQSAKYKADLVDPLQLVGVEACLATLQKILGEGVSRTQTAGSLSRHGVAHGRELAYDTRVNSAKYWSVLHALVQWAGPLAQQQTVRLRREREAAAAGSEGTDENGRRLDNREFRETKAMLRKLLTSAIGWLASTGHLRRDLIGGVYTSSDFLKAGLPADPGIETRVAADGMVIWFWRATVSGWVLGAAVGVSKNGFDEWLYSAPTAPIGGPREALDVWGQPFATPVDWTA